MKPSDNSVPEAERVPLPEHLDVEEKGDLPRRRRSAGAVDRAVIRNSVATEGMILPEDPTAHWGTHQSTGTIRRALRKCGSSIVVLGVAVVFYLVAREVMEADPETLRNAEATESKANPAEITPRIASLVTSYFPATSVDDKLSFVRRQPTVRPLMERFYGQKTLTPETVVHVAVRLYHQELTRANELYLVAVSTDENEQGYALLVEEIDNRYLIDWESQVAYNPMTFQAFVDEKPTTAQSFRVYVRLSEYYNYSYDDPNRYLALELTFPDGDRPLYGYISRNIPSLSRNLPHLGADREVPMIVDLRFPQGAPEHSDQVEVTSLVQHRWIVP